MDSIENKVGSQSVILRVKKLEPGAKLPKKKTEGAAAFDLFALESCCLSPFKITKVRTGIAMEVPPGYKGEIYSRSGLASQGVSIANQPGKIDCDYRGEIILLLQYIPQINIMDNIIRILYKIVDGEVKEHDDVQRELNDGDENAISSVDRWCGITGFRIEAGDRIAQFELQEVVPTKIRLVKNLSETERGAGGFGSTGR